MLEYQVLRCICRDKTIVKKYKEALLKVELDAPIKKIMLLIFKYYDLYENHNFISYDELVIFLKCQYPGDTKLNDYIDIINSVFDLDTSDSLARLCLIKLIKKDYGVKLLNAVMPVLNDDVPDDILDTVTKHSSEISDVLESIVERPSFYVDTPLSDLMDAKAKHGLRWPLRCLHEDLGLISGNTLGHVFALPDAGKTSFVHFLSAKLARQLAPGETLIWFNNEEGGNKVRLRTYSAVCNATEEEITNNITLYQDMFQERAGNKILLYDKALLTIEEIEKECLQNHTRFAIVDIGDKVRYRGKDKAENGAGALQGVYDNLREVVKRVNLSHKFDMLTTGQAGATAGQWLTLADLYGGKTGKAGAFDYIIGLGTQEDHPAQRFVSFPKNKVGTRKRRHTINFDPLRATFTDLGGTNDSRF